jgi:DedD protein
MRGVFDDREQEPAQAQRDTELTLGSGALLAMGFGLLILCGFCFALGYMVGHRGAAISPESAPQTAAGSQPAASASLNKPSAAPQLVAAAARAPDSPGPPRGDASVPAPVAGEGAPAATPPGAAPSAPQVRSALAPAAETGQPGQSAAPNAVRPALGAAAQLNPGPAPAGSLMVQIAAVSNAEDAEVLTNALRKRGYAVTTRREPADNLIHVRIGPFATPAEANTWKMKLLNDGYNAIVQQ